MEPLGCMKSISLKIKIIGGIILALLLLALSSAIYAWYVEKNKPPISKVEYIKVPEIKEVIKIKRVEIPIEKIVTIEKQVLIEKIKMPEWFRTDTNKQAIATAVIPAYEGNTNAVAIVDTKTGVGEIVVKQEPLSLVRFANDRQLYGKAGFSTNKETQVTIGAEWKFVRVGKIKVGVFGEGRAAFGTEDTGSRQAVEAIGGVIVAY
jgi:hypothetical protein